MPRLADQQRYLASESTFYRILRAADQQHRRGRSQPPRTVKGPTSHVATAANQVWSWEHHLPTYLPACLPADGGAWSVKAKSLRGTALLEGFDPSQMSPHLNRIDQVAVFRKCCFKPITRYVVMIEVEDCWLGVPGSTERDLSSISPPAIAAGTKTSPSLLIPNILSHSGSRVRF